MHYSLTFILFGPAGWKLTYLAWECLNSVEPMSDGGGMEVLNVSVRFMFGDV